MTRRPESRFGPLPQTTARREVGAQTIVAETTRNLSCVLS
jgi:hypothetical protein